MMVRLVVAAVLLGLAVVPSAAHANRSPGWLYVGEAAASIREYYRGVGDVADARLTGTKVGGCRRYSALKVTCLGEGEYSPFDGGSSFYCHSTFIVTEVKRSGRHKVRLKDYPKCVDYSIFE